MTNSHSTLLVDADDTLWENAVHFQQARHWWMEAITRRGVNGERARTLFEGLEHDSFRHGWFGSSRLEHNMLEAATRLLGGLAPGLRSEIIEVADDVRNHEIKLFEGVHETLVQLESRHRLMVVTMGCHQEQGAKVARSGLADIFEHVEVVRDKTVESYRRVLRERGVDRDCGWMIGNSLSKDVEPARLAGLSTVHVDNGTSFPPGDGKPDLVIRQFTELLEHF